jgi:hypothetical protein
MQCWEYKVIAIDAHEGQRFFHLGGEIHAEPTSKRLTDLGNEGWELVSSFDTNWGHGASRKYVFVFKRPHGG